MEQEHGIAHTQPGYVHVHLHTTTTSVEEMFSRYWCSTEMYSVLKVHQCAYYHLKVSTYSCGIGKRKTKFFSIFIFI